MEGIYEKWKKKNKIIEGNEDWKGCLIRYRMIDMIKEKNKKKWKRGFIYKKKRIEKWIKK